VLKIKQYNFLKFTATKHAPHHQDWPYELNFIATRDIPYEPVFLIRTTWN